MATWLSMVNNVQKRLRETQTASVTSTEYSTLIGQFVNDAKREVENRWMWSDFINAQQEQFTSGTSTIAVPSSSYRSIILKVWNSTNPHPLTQTSIRHIKDLQYSTAAIIQGRPQWWALNSYDTAGNITLEFYPTPNNTDFIRILQWTPQADLAADSTAIEINHYPVELGAYMRAVSERGEDGGAVYDEVNAMYNRAISDMIGREQKMNPEAFNFYAR